MKQRKRIIAALAAAAMVFSSVNAFAAQSWRASQVRVDLEPVDNYKLDQGNSLGDWSFFETAGYWPVSTVVRNQGYLVPGTTDQWITEPGITLDEYKYGDTANTSYFKPMTKIYPGGRTYTYDPILSSRSERGVIISGNGSAADFWPLINIRTNASDGLNEFVVQGAPYSDDNTGDAIVCFTIPAAGDYEIYHRFMNKGTGITGGSGMVRRTIIRNGESTFESAENSVDQTFGAYTVAGQAAPEATGTLRDTFAKGDKIYFRVNCLKDNYNDKFFGNIKITKRDELGNVEKIYNLNDLTMSGTEQWRYYTSGPNANETNPDNWYRLHVKPNHGTDYVFPNITDGVNNAEKMTAAMFYWTLAGGSAISFARRDIGYPYFEWFYDETADYVKYENGVSAVMTQSGAIISNGYLAKNYSMILAWVAPKDGYYKAGYEYAKHTKNAGSDADGDTEDTRIDVQLYKTGKTAPEATWGSNYIPNDGTNAVMEYMPIIEMKAGDRIMYRITCEDEYSGERVVQFAPVITEAETVTSYHSINGTELKVASSYTDYAMEMDPEKEMQFIYSVLDENGVIAAVYVSESFSLSQINSDGYNWSGQIEDTFTLPKEGNYKVVTYLWDSINSMQPIHPKTRCVSGDN